MGYINIYIVTFDEKKYYEIPALSEAKMIQAYFSKHKTLPLLNKEA